MSKERFTYIDLSPSPLCDEEKYDADRLSYNDQGNDYYVMSTGFAVVYDQKSGVAYTVTEDGFHLSAVKASVPVKP